MRRDRKAGLMSYLGGLLIGISVGILIDLPPIAGTGLALMGLGLLLFRPAEAVP